MSNEHDAPRKPTAAGDPGWALRKPDEPINRAAVLYPNCYSWYVFMASLDIMMTTIILDPFFGGTEVNWLARLILEMGGLPAAIVYKFALVMIVIVICEIVGRRVPDTGRRLAEWAVAITAIPVIVSFAQLLVDVGVVVIGRSG